MKSCVALICAVCLALMPEFAMAASTATVTVSASVDSQLDLSMWIKKVQDSQDPGTEGTEVTTMSFGPLTDTFSDGTKAGNLFSRTWFAVFLIANTAGRSYIVRQSAGSLTSGSQTIPNNCFMMVPDYRSEDKFTWSGGSAAQGAMPAGAKLGSAGSAVGTNKTIYTSDSAGIARIIRCYYSLTNGYKGDGTKWPGFSGTGIPLDQAAGNYSASVTFSVVLQ